jgi:Phage tail tube protein
MAVKHFIYSKESGMNTWTTPAKWLWVNSANITGKREVLPQRLTGGGRDLVSSVLGAKPVNGPLRLPWWFTNVGTLFNSFLTDITTTPGVGTGVYDHALLYDDAAAFDTLSLQLLYNTDFGVNILGAAVNSLTLDLATKQQAMLTFDIVAKDEAKCGGTWEDGTASAAALTTPAYPTGNRGFLFYDATITLDGTPDLDAVTKKISITDGDENILLRDLSIKWNHNLDTDAYGLTMDPTLVEQSPGDRVIEATFNMSWSDYSDTFYDAGRAGTSMSLNVDLQGPALVDTEHYEAHLCIPSLYIPPLELPELTGDQKTQLITIKGSSQLDAVTGVSFGMWLRTSEATL